MAGDAFNIGSDATLTILVNGNPFKASKLTKFTLKQLVAELKSVPISGKPKFRNVEEGWSFDCEYDRTDGVLDDFIARKEAARYNGRQPPEIAITYTIKDAKGNKTKYRLEDCTVVLEDAGNIAGNEKIVQKMNGKASQRVKA